MKKKLLVILGSGSSIPLGFPSVDEVNRLMRNWASDWAAMRGWPDYFGELWDAITRYQLPQVHSWLPPVSYERVLANMLALSHWVTPPPSGDPLRGVLGDIVALSRFPEPDDHGPELTLREQISFLTRRLGGYGFADMHINRALTHRLSDPNRPPVMILDRRDVGALTVANEPWKTGACSALRTDGWFFKPNSDDRLELNSVHRVALWRDGFITAGESPELFTWLRTPASVRPA